MTNPNVTIRQAKPADAAAILPLIQALAAHHGDDPQATVASLETDLREVAVILLAYADNRLAGYAALLPLAQVQHGVRGMELHHLFVVAQYRGCGIGSALNAACKGHATQAGCKYLMVGTHSDNTAAQATYRAWGFADAPTAGPRFKMLLG